MKQKRGGVEKDVDTLKLVGNNKGLDFLMVLTDFNHVFLLQGIFSNFVDF
jgi:hypothetical protein